MDERAGHERHAAHLRISSRDLERRLLHGGRRQKKSTPSSARRRLAAHNLSSSTITAAPAPATAATSTASSRRRVGPASRPTGRTVSANARLGEAWLGVRHLRLSRREREHLFVVPFVSVGRMAIGRHYRVLHGRDHRCDGAHRSRGQSRQHHPDRCPGQTVTPNVNKSSSSCTAIRMAAASPSARWSRRAGHGLLRRRRLHRSASHYLKALASWPPPTPPPPPSADPAVGCGDRLRGLSWFPTYQPDAAHVTGYNWRSAHYFASRSDLGIQKFKYDADPDPAWRQEIDIASTPRPTARIRAQSHLARPAGPDLQRYRRDQYFRWSTGVAAPTSEPCAPGAPGAPLPASPPRRAVRLVHPDGYERSLRANGLAYPTGCARSLPPLPGHRQQHYLVVYHNMNHINGGLAIKTTFGSFIEKISTLSRVAMVWSNCAND